MNSIAMNKMVSIVSMLLAVIAFGVNLRYYGMYHGNGTDKMTEPTSISVMLLAVAVILKQVKFKD